MKVDIIMADNKQYVCSINLMDRYKRFIKAGAPFEGEVLHTHSLKRLILQGYASEYVPTAPITTITVPKGKSLVGLTSSTPDAAIHPPKLSEADQLDVTRQAIIDRKVAATKVAQKAVDKATEKVNKAKVAQAEEAEAQANMPVVVPVVASPKNSSVEKVWDADPEIIKDLAHEQLLSIYLDQCIAFNIEPEEFDSIELLRAQLSSQFNT